MNRRESKCLKLTLALVDRGAYDGSLQIIVDLSKLIRDCTTGYLGGTRRRGCRIAYSGVVKLMKMDDCYWETTSDEHISVAQRQGTVDGGSTGGLDLDLLYFFFKNMDT